MTDTQTSLRRQLREAKAEAARDRAERLELMVKLEMAEEEIQRLRSEKGNSK